MAACSSLKLEGGPVALMVEDSYRYGVRQDRKNASFSNKKITNDTGWIDDRDPDNRAFPNAHSCPNRMFILDRSEVKNGVNHVFRSYKHCILSGRGLGVLGSGFWVQGRRQPKKRPVKSKKKLIVHRRARSLRPLRAVGSLYEPEAIGHKPTPGGRTLRKKIYNNLCALSGLCGEILLGMASEFMKFHARGSRFRVQRFKEGKNED
jgi:hypothetical protein